MSEADKKEQQARTESLAEIQGVSDLELNSEQADGVQAGTPAYKVVIDPRPVL